MKDVLNSMVFPDKLVSGMWGCVSAVWLRGFLDLKVPEGANPRIIKEPV